MARSVANIPRSIFYGRAGHAFASSTFVVVCLVMLFGAAMYPNLVIGLPGSGEALTIYDASSSVSTLKLMTVIAALGMPFVLTYTFIIYRTYWGEVRLDDHSY